MCFPPGFLHIHNFLLLCFWQIVIKMRPAFFYFFLSILVLIVAVKKSFSKASSFQMITKAEKELLQRRETDVKSNVKIKIDKSNKRRKRKRKQRKKRKKKKQRKNKRKSGKQRLENKTKKRKSSLQKKKDKKTNQRRSKATDTQSRSHKQNLLQHVLEIEEKTRGRNVDRAKEILSLDENSISNSQNGNNSDATQFEKTQDNPVSSNKVKKEKRQKKKKKKKKKKRRKAEKKCKYTKRDLEAKNEKTCNRAKERAKLSYKTMDLLFEQIFDESLIFSKVTKREKIHSRFFRAAEAFVSNSTVCEGNPSWNSVLLNEKLNEFKENIDELGRCFLGQKLTSDRESETFDENTVGLSKSDREGLENCLETQNKTDRCAHCSNKCGEALKNGEICVERAVRLLEKARRSRENCQSQFRKLDKMQQRLVHDMYG